MLCFSLNTASVATPLASREIHKLRNKLWHSVGVLGKIQVVCSQICAKKLGGSGLGGDAGPIG
uniref:Uncharacterized protein n=1 Tax=Romanomermis culicivorax TaxID=13658 RepID=A0A915I034_ROMCU